MKMQYARGGVDMELNVIVAGVGGQGSVLVSSIIAGSAIKEHGRKYQVRVGETFGAAQRGGAVASHVRIGDNVHAPLVSRGSADLIIGLEPLEALRLGVPFLAPNGLTVLNIAKQVPVDVKVGAVEYPQIEDIINALNRLGKQVVSFNGDELAAEAGNPRVMSIIMLGAAHASGLLPFSEETVLSVIGQKVPAKTLDLNREAFEIGKKAYAQSV